MSVNTAENNYPLGILDFSLFGVPLVSICVCGLAFDPINKFRLALPVRGTVLFPPPHTGILNPTPIVVLTECSIRVVR